MQFSIQMVVEFILLILASSFTVWTIISIINMRREHKIEEEKALERLDKQVKREKSRARKMWKK